MNKLTAGQAIELKGFIQVSGYGYLTWASCDMTDHGYTVIMPHTISATVPDDFNPIAAEVSAIEKKLDAMADEYHGKVAQLKRRKAELLCIEL